MSTFFLLFLPVIVPILGGFGVFIIRFQNRTARQIYVGAVVIVNMILSLVAIFVAPKGQTVTLIPFTENYSIALRLDGMAVFFGFILCTLWVVATFYSFEYMKHEGKEKRYFGFAVMTVKKTSFSASTPCLLVLQWVLPFRQTYSHSICSMNYSHWEHCLLLCMQ